MVEDVPIEETTRQTKFTGFVVCAFKKCPRITSILVGIVLPLWSLIGIATLFGNILSRLEAPNEIVDNDDQLAYQTGVSVFALIVGNITTRAPKVCFELYLRNQSLPDFIDSIENLFNTTTPGLADERLQDALLFDETYGNDNVLGAGEVVVVNLTDMYAHMDQCGRALNPVLGGFFDLFSAANNLSGRLTFNWNRCLVPPPEILDAEEDKEGRYMLGLGESNGLANERFNYVNTWRSDQRRLYRDFLGNEPLDSLNLTHRFQAFNRSIREASGQSACSIHTSSGAWFFFTIMTTIGYGNQSPVTRGGRLMVFTLGFCSIVAFAAVLATAGFVTMVIFDDAVHRFQLRWFNRPSVACFVWGGFYYTWMLVIATYYKQWRKDRLGDDEFGFNDSYWFAFLSTTTIGLGDYYLNPEGFRPEDLLSYPILFLFGFVLLASFLGKVSEVFSGPFSNNGKMLEQVLKDTDMVPDTTLSLPNLSHETGAPESDLAHRSDAPGKAEQG